MVLLYNSKGQLSLEVGDLSFSILMKMNLIFAAYSFVVGITYAIDGSMMESVKSGILSTISFTAFNYCRSMNSRGF